MEQLFAALRGKQLVRGVRGPGGGYYLGRASHEISIADIICAVDEWVEFTRCKGRKDCRNGDRCLTHDLWNDLSDEIFNFLSGITLTLPVLGSSTPTEPPQDVVPLPLEDGLTVGELVERGTAGKKDNEMRPDDLVAGQGFKAA